MIELQSWMVVKVGILQSFADLIRKLMASILRYKAHTTRSVGLGYLCSHFILDAFYGANMAKYKQRSFVVCSM